MQVGAASIVRQMYRHELDLVLDWAAAEDWNPGLFDAEAFFNADPRGFFLAERDGQPVGAIAAVAYDYRFGFIGLFIVKPEHRGERYGVELGRRALDYLGTRTIGIDAVRIKQENYRRHGFSHAYWTIRFRGTSPSNLQPTIDSPAHIEFLRDLPPELIYDYDTAIFPAQRELFLRTWINQPGHTALGLIQQDRLAGYGVIRPCQTGYKIGPLFADDPSVAEVLFDALLTSIPGEEYYIDVPEPNKTAALMVNRRLMQPIFETSRMYRGPAPQTDLNKIFGVTSLELG